MNEEVIEQADVKLAKERWRFRKEVLTMIERSERSCCALCGKEVPNKQTANMENLGLGNSFFVVCCEACRPSDE